MLESPGSVLVPWASCRIEARMDLPPDGPDTEFIDFDQVHFPLHVRPPAPGRSVRAAGDGRLEPRHWPISSEAGTSLPTSAYARLWSVTSSASSGSPAIGSPIASSGPSRPAARSACGSQKLQNVNRRYE